ncbi:hypothetical protein DR864_28360 (plasmid) [Runella rosea]|uniref:Uncharacterized protein n=1 Tax=Runella rosea TaxID=2259595 RepID=A0A344TT18_9BACT|nr:hypothetical protein [Runella rosea]AXE21789.1 hypothetical protein DR864_28360 [Runella rosea]
MKRIVYFIFMLIFCTSVYSQSNTDEMLGAPKAFYFIQLWPDFLNNKFTYTIDSDGPSSKAKTLKNLTVGVPKKSKEVALTIRFYNPLRYSIKTSDTMMIDPSYQSIGQFASALTSLLGTLPNAAPTPNLSDVPGTAASFATSNASLKASQQDILAVFPAGKFEPFTVQIANNQKTLNTLHKIDSKESLNWVKRINSLRAEELAEWKFFSLQGNIRCIDTTSKVLKDLKILDDRYFNTSIRGVMKEYLTKLSQPDNIIDFQKVNERFKAAIDSLDKVNQNNIKLLLSFNDLISDDISKDLLRKDVDSTNEASCNSFVNYSQIVFKRFVRARAEFQEKRNQMLDLAKKISREVDDLMTKAIRPPNGVKDLENAFILNQYDIQLEKMRDIRISVQERKLNLTASPPSIDKTDKHFEGKLRLRAAQTFVPEFSMGGFYTSLSFPSYNVKVINGQSVIGRAEEDYSVGVAGMLNLTLNAIEGLAHPLVQIGVGTGKNRPTLLSGAGFRLSWKMPIIITGGAIWHWQQKLINGKQENSLISDDTELKKNLEYRFITKPGFYFGLQIGI